MRLQLYTPPSGYPDPFAEVGYLRVTAEGDDFGTHDVFMEFPTRAGELSSIPYGEGVQLTVESYKLACVPNTAGVDANVCAVDGACDNPTMPCSPAPGSLVGRGRTPLMAVSSKTDPRAVAVFMMELESYAPTTSAMGGASKLTTGRIGHSVTELEDGRVLIVGGGSLLDGTTDFTNPDALGTIYNTAEIYDPASGAFTPVAAPMSIGRAFHKAVRLPDEDNPDRIAIFGGYSDVNGVRQSVVSVEIFDPVSDTFSSQVMPMLAPRAYQTATLLGDDGRVLLTGGRGEGASNSWEVWHPLQGPIAQGPLSVNRWNHTATPAPAPGGGEYIYLFGGENDTGIVDSAEIFSAVENALLAGVFAMKNGGTLHTAQYVSAHGFIYIIGGFSDAAKTRPLSRVDVFQVNCGGAAQGLGLESCWREDVPFQLGAARGGHQTTQLPGQVLLITGGVTNLADDDPMVTLSEVIVQTDVLDADTGAVSRKVELKETRMDPIWPRVGHQAIALSSQHVFLSGGANKTGGVLSMQTDTELFNPR